MRSVIIFLSVVATVCLTIEISRRIDERKQDRLNADNAVQDVKNMLAELNEQGY